MTIGTLLGWLTGDLQIHWVVGASTRLRHIVQLPSLITACYVPRTGFNDIANNDYLENPHPITEKCVPSHSTPQEPLLMAVIGRMRMLCARESL
jgi:hypothetical protein